ncbi:MAG: hypothetical protein RLZZ142_2016, partial [Verrucomicrobiota bacterium]
KPTPMDIEWAWEGPGHAPWILQARPETVHAGRPPERPGRFVLHREGHVLLTGISVGTRIASGVVRVLDSPSEMDRFQPGEILVTEKTNPDWEPIMRRAGGIITERGGRTCHAAIVSRELGVAALVGASGALKTLANGQEITLDCAGAEQGRVLEGRLPFGFEPAAPLQKSPLRTRLLLNIADPDQAMRLRQLPCEGVGLLREEFLLASQIGIHPLALLHHPELPSALRDEIERRTPGYSEKPQFFIDRLAEGIARIAAAFHPRPVLVRLSDLKTNEYARLLGGEAYEPPEENPMLGFRGASRYTHPDFKEAFTLECAALRRVREDMGLRNVRILIPFCRTPEEADRVLLAMEAAGLRRGCHALEIWMMCEIPSNVVLAEEFARRFDGFSIGTNDLTQLVLGVDRDSERVAPLFNEGHPAVTQVLGDFIRRAHACGKPVSVCGQAPSDSPEFARFLIQQGIDSLSLTADALLATRALVARAEAEQPPGGPSASALGTQPASAP